MCDKVKFFPKQFNMPSLSSANTATRSAVELTESSRHPHTNISYAPLSDNTITKLKELSDIFTNATIANPALPASSHPDTTKLPRVKTRKAGEDTRVEELQEEISPTIKTEICHRIPNTHRYPTRYKALAIQAIIMSELTKTIEKPNHDRVYYLSYRASQQYINAILNTVTVNMMEYRHLNEDLATSEVWEKSSANEFGRLMKNLKRGIQGTETMKFIQKHEVPYNKRVTYA